jgi:hypothetical protein
MQVGHFNSSLNSILYGFTNRHFREGYKQFLTKFIPGLHKVFYVEPETTDTSLSGSDSQTRKDMKTKKNVLAKRTSSAFPFFFLSLHFPLFAFAICRLLRLTYRNILV